MTTYTFTITSAAQFNTDIALIDVGGSDAGGINNIYNFNITAGFTLDRQLDAINLTDGTASGDVLNISGLGSPGGVATLNANSTYNGLFVYDGTVNISGLTIANAAARGGAGGSGGGAGGAGLGGGLFIAGQNPIAAGSTTMTTGGNVTLYKTGFTGDSAVGGAGSAVGNLGNSGAGGGGGLGGAGGNNRNGFTYGGGGGVGLGAYGGYSDHKGGNGIILGAQPGGSTYKHGAGGANAGGGGSGNYATASGGGGVGGGAIPPPIIRGGAFYYYGLPSAGFGGGGGGAGEGGFGGGGGGGGAGFVGGTGYTAGGRGGFGGGGGGGGGQAYSGGAGGFGGGHGAKATPYTGRGAGGGGLGAGADIFIQQGGKLTIQTGSSLAAGTVSGGAGGGLAQGASSSAGAAFGNGLFIQGNQTVTFASDNQSITVAGVIADETGSVLPAGDGTGTGAGALAADNALLTLSGANTYSGGTTIAGGNLDLAHADIVSGGKVISGAAGTGAIIFAGTAANPSDLTLETAAKPTPGGTFITPITDFGANDALILKGLTYTADSTAIYDASTHLLTVTSNGIVENYTLSAPASTTFHTHVQAFGGAGTRVDTVCFCSGTRIRISRGGAIDDVAVERLAVGDLAVTASGAHRPIRWIGQRSVDCRQHPHPDAARPVRIAAHAIAPNQPARDLLLSPGHAICLDIVNEVLIPAGALLNGSTIRKVNADRVTYWHIELDTHDILLAENLPAESYLEMGNRGFFTGEDTASPDADIEYATSSQAGFCRPLHAGGPLVDVVRAQLRARAETRGWTLDATDPWAGLHLIADGARIDPVCRDLFARFTVPAGTRDVWMISAASRPCEVGDSPDDRALGICLRALTITDGFSTAVAIDLADPLLSTGFYAPEGSQRWTTGRASLPAELWTRLDTAADGFFLCVERAGPAVPRWIAPADATPVVVALPSSRHLAIAANAGLAALCGPAHGAA